jgi:toxin CptA
MPQHTEASLLLAIKPSHHLKALIIITHALALGASIANDLDLAFKLGLITVISLQGWLTIKRLKNEAYTIKYTEALGWQLSKDQDLVSIEILNSTIVTTFAIFLHYKERSPSNFKTPRAKRTRLILNDALSDEDYRCLLVKLKITH